MSPGKPTAKAHPQKRSMSILLFRQLDNEKQSIYGPGTLRNKTQGLSAPTISCFPGRGMIHQVLSANTI